MKKKTKKNKKKKKKKKKKKNSIHFLKVECFLKSNSMTLKQLPFN